MVSISSKSTLDFELVILAWRKKINQPYMVNAESAHVTKTQQLEDMLADASTVH
jgi:hypothetical protein